MRMVYWNKRSLVIICRYQLLPRRHGGHPWPSIRWTVHWGRMLSYIINLLLFCHYMLWIIKILPWRPERNMWFWRGSQNDIHRLLQFYPPEISYYICYCKISCVAAQQIHRSSTPYLRSTVGQWQRSPVFASRLSGHKLKYRT